ncbi:hypothetical protein [Billgrantia endophytica]|uniref:Uncharacterized protein n=1 Tax=Billgrantia endophytica TaxID=2033802 RepID=A0A2N7TUD0_9GAMM|nr:hypothetical protein [Halomonas endophytica]PMR71802.1 hypothetical protein C1H69_22985 [Halomonas endophytica]
MIQKVRALKKKISSLHKKLEVANNNIEGKKEAYENSIRYKENIQRQIYEAQQELENTSKSDELIVSDHSLIRYLERVKGLDIEALRQEIVTDEMKALYKKLGDGKYPIEQEGGKAVIKNGIIVSIV